MIELFDYRLVREKKFIVYYLKAIVFLHPERKILRKHK
jgi:hypothetical protein